MSNKRDHEIINSGTPQYTPHPNEHKIAVILADGYFDGLNLMVHYRTNEIELRKNGQPYVYTLTHLKSNEMPVYRYDAVKTLERMKRANK